MEQKNPVKNSKEFWILSNLLEKIDIRINGNRAWDIQIKDPGIAKRIMTTGGLGLGDAYIDGDWDAGSVDSFIDRILRARLDKEFKNFGTTILSLKSHFSTPSRPHSAWKLNDLAGELPNEFFEAMLGSSLSFTCGYWANGAKTLEEAQNARHDLICKKLDLKPGMRLLDAGSSWGSLAAFAAENYGIECVSTCMFKAQLEWASQRYAHLPVEFTQREALMLDGTYDRIISINRFEHLPSKSYRAYMETIDRCLKNNGLFMMQTLGKNARRVKGKHWIDTHLLQNGALPTVAEIAQATDRLFIMEDMHNFGADYDKTLMAWYTNFETAWPQLSEKYKLDNKFYRTWKYFLLCSAGSYRANDLQHWLYIFSKPESKNKVAITL